MPRKALSDLRGTTTLEAPIAPDHGICQSDSSVTDKRAQTDEKCNLSYDQESVRKVQWTRPARTDGKAGIGRHENDKTCLIRRFNPRH